MGSARTWLIILYVSMRFTLSFSRGASEAFRPGFTCACSPMWASSVLGPAPLLADACGDECGMAAAVEPPTASTCILSGCGASAATGRLVIIASMLQEASVPLSTNGDASMWCCDSHGWGCSIWLTSVGSCDENRWKDVVAASSWPSGWR